MASAGLRAAITRLTGHPSSMEASLLFDELDSNSNFWEHHRIGRTQLNELLLALAYETVDEPFFQVFLARYGSSPEQGLDRVEFEKGIEEFEKVSLLKYGNVKFGFKHLAQATAGHLRTELADTRAIDVETYRTRPEPLLKTTTIDPDESHFLGHLTSAVIVQGNDEALKMRLHECQTIGKRNLQIYLCSDELDVYVATSMRDIEDFYFVGHAVRRLFAKPSIDNLKLRYFDPTQAFCASRIEKGLVESLMLRRAKCTVYCAQTTETLGKDSELAVTLAQGKPVIVYAPSIRGENNEDEYRELCKRIASISARITGRSLSDYYRDKLIARHARSLGRDLELLSSTNEAELLDQLIALDDALFNGNAKKLKDQHPLGIQVNLDTGVANGVLVTRTLTECAEVIRDVMLNQMRFDIARDPDDTTRLVEVRTGCTYRLMVSDPLLTNSFWNFYRPWIGGERTESR